MPDSLHLKLFPASVKLTFRVVVSEFENIQQENLMCVVDYNQIADGAPSRLAIQVPSFPDYIGNIKINPETVSYILESK